MAITDEATYGESYFSKMMAARQEQDELDGEDFITYIPNMFGTMAMQSKIPGDFMSKWKALIASPSVGLAGVGGRFLSEIADNIVGHALDPAMVAFDHEANKAFQDRYMSPGEASRLRRRLWITDQDARERFASAGFSQHEQSLMYAATAPEIAIPDWIRWARYQVEPQAIWSQLFDKVELDRRDWDMWQWLGQQQFTTDQILNLYKRGSLEKEFPTRLLNQLGWNDDKHATLIDLAYAIPNPMILIQGNLMAEATDEDILLDIGRGDIHPEYYHKYMDAVLTKPNSGDIIQYHLRQDNDLENLDGDLRRIGIHPEYFELYHRLAQPIPGIADLITMAVREAFSPEVATRFGQYEDFPEPFADFARQQGMTEEWAKRYWAAHWNLPSPQQGFAMLHRGVIDEDDLDLLLRSQDVMPFWRHKLTQIAYKPLSRVDVRRMYKEGVLSEREVLSSYLDQGYDKENAGRMTEFTIKSTLSSLAKFSSTDILRAYTTGVIKQSEAGNLLRSIGIKSNDVSTIISFASYKRDWDYTQDRIGAIGNLLRKEVYSTDKARSEMGRLNLPSDQVEVQMDRWYSEAAEKPPVTWTKAETLKFMTQNVITHERGIQELERIGYDDEHIAAYLTTIT